MRTLLTTFLVTLVCVTSAGAAQVELPVLLDKLVGGDDFVIIGDLRFENFFYPADSVVQGDMPFASQIAVQPIPGDTGIRFTGPFIDLPGGVGNGASDASLGFDVSVVSGAQIVGANLSGNPSLKGDELGIAEVVETFSGLNDTKLVIFDKGENLNLNASADIPATNSLSVIKDILLLSQSETNAATISVIDQTFEIVPEPSSTLLLSVGALCVGLRRRRRR